MSEPLKMLTVVMPYKTYEMVKKVAKEADISAGKIIRLAIDSFLKSTNSQTKR